MEGFGKLRIRRLEKRAAYAIGRSSSKREAALHSTYTYTYLDKGLPNLIVSPCWSVEGEQWPARFVDWIALPLIWRPIPILTSMMHEGSLPNRYQPPMIAWSTSAHSCLN